MKILSLTLVVAGAVGALSGCNDESPLGNLAEELNSSGGPVEQTRRVVGEAADETAANIEEGVDEAREETAAAVEAVTVEAAAIEEAVEGTVHGTAAAVEEATAVEETAAVEEPTE